MIFEGSYNFIIMSIKKCHSLEADFISERKREKEKDIERKSESQGGGR